MFDVSLSELMVIAVVALLVIGPEKLPKVARTVGAFTGRMQRYMAQIKEEVNREMRFEELQKLQQEIKQSVENTQNSANQQVAEIKNAVSQGVESEGAESKNAKSSVAKQKKVISKAKAGAEKTSPEKTGKVSQPKTKIAANKRDKVAAE